MAKVGGNKVPEITGAEHISPEHTGDNISAKRSANYVWDGSNWQRMTQAGGLTPNVDYDYLDVQQTSSTVDTFVFKSGGSGGTTVLTIVVTYTDSTKSDINYVSWA